jgi:DNA-binding NtrC family response regulator
MNESLMKILVIDDEKRVREELADFFSNQNYTFFEAPNFNQGLELLNKTEIDFVILDIRLPDVDGLSGLNIIKENFPNVEVIMVTGHGDINVVIECLRRGASDYLSKPFTFNDLNAAIERTKKFAQLSERLKLMEQSFQIISNELESRDHQVMIAESQAMKNVLGLMELVAKSDSTTVLVIGETGTGKELVAKGIHQISDRRKKLFHAINCSAIPESLFESELFGYNKGAFTGAVENKPGWFEIADQGTLFLDEIGDLPLNMQSKLLRIIEDKQVSRLGGRKQSKVDVRIVAATNQPISNSAQFRSDLYHRLSTFIIQIPPLRERKEDILAIADYYIQQFSKSMRKNITGMDTQFANFLTAYHFPGNVRELKNIIERAVILCPEGNLNIQNLSRFISEAQEKIKTETTFSLDTIEKFTIQKALDFTGNNKTQAAKLLEITWQSLNRRMQKFGME